MPSLETRCDAPVRVCITVCSCESRTRRGDFDFEWVMRVGLGGLGAWRVRVRCASWLYAPCFACVCDAGREREKEESEQESDLEEDHGRYRMRGRRVGVRGMDMACESPALFPASCPALDRERKPYGFRRPVSLPFLPALFPPLLRQVLMLDQATERPRARANVLTVVRACTVPLMSTRSESIIHMSGLGGRQRGIRKSRWPASSWSR